MFSEKAIEICLNPVQVFLLQYYGEIKDLKNENFQFLKWIPMPVLFGMR